MERELDESTQRLVRLIAGDLIKNPVFDDYEVEDLENDLFVYLLEIADQFESPRGHWTGFVRTRLLQKGRDIIKLRNVAKRFHKKVSLHAVICNDEHGDETILADLIPVQGQDPAKEAIFAVDRDECLAGLPPEYRMAYDELMAGSQVEAASNMGVPRATFQRKHLASLRLALQSFDC